MQYSGGVPYRFATATVTADNVQCTEHRVSTTRNVVEGFICVKEGQTLEINCEVIIDSDECQVDLIIDGILRGTMINRKKSVHKKKFAFKHGLHKVARKTWRGSMKVSDLDLKSFDSTSPTKVGTIELQITRAENLLTHIQNVAPYYEVTRWKDLALPYGNGGIDPKYQISFEDDEMLTNSMASTVREKIRRPRAGQSTWATFRFLYRDEASLRNAGITASAPVSTIARGSSPAFTRSSTSSRESTPITKRPTPIASDPTPALSDLARSLRAASPSPRDSITAPTQPKPAPKALSRSTGVLSNHSRVSTHTRSDSTPLQSDPTPVTRVSIFGPTSPILSLSKTTAAQENLNTTSSVIIPSSAHAVVAASALPDEAHGTLASVTTFTELGSEIPSQDNLGPTLTTVIPQTHIKSEHPIIKIEKVHDANHEHIARVSTTLPHASNAKGPQWGAHSRAIVRGGPHVIKGLGLDLSQVNVFERVDQLPLDATTIVREASEVSSTEIPITSNTTEVLSAKATTMAGSEEIFGVLPKSLAVSGQEAIHLDELSLSDRRQQPLPTPTTSATELDPLAPSTVDLTHGRQKSLFITPGPEERVLLQQMTHEILQQPPTPKLPTSTTRMKEQDIQVAQHPEKTTELRLVICSGNKRSFDIADDARQSIETPSLDGYDQPKTKRRKKDIQALEAEISKLAKEREESARRREEARRRIEEYDSIMAVRYEALEREKQEIIRHIEEDRKAEEAYINQQRQLEDESS